MKTMFLLTMALFTSLAWGATAGSDNAANYASGSFTNGANQGTGFQAWNIFAENSGGTFLGDSTVGCGDINTSGQSFGMWGNVGGANYIHCYRKFAGGALTEGQKFTCRLAVNWRNGNKGIDILGGGSVIFNINVGGDNYTYHPTNAANISFGWGWGEKSILNCTFEQRAGNVLSVMVQRTSGSITDNFAAAFSLPSSADEFQWYCGATDAGDNNNLYGNSLVIIPEPASLLAMALGVLLVVRARR
jgi:hypothetical protein